METVLVYGVTREQLKGLNRDCIEAAVVCYSGGKFVQDSTLWRNVEIASDMDINKPLAGDKLGTLLRDQNTVTDADSRWLRSLVDELCENAKPSTEMSEAESANRTTDSPQSEMEIRLRELADQLEKERQKSQMLENQMWQLKLQQKEELDELTTKCEQLEAKYAEKVKECKHLCEVRHSLQEKIDQREMDDRRCSNDCNDDSTEDKEAHKDGKTLLLKKDQLLGCQTFES